jgi:hypothetical protein
MNRRHRLSKILHYLTEGMACGLGGVLLIGLPAFGVTVLFFAFHDSFARLGFTPPDLAGWLWTSVLGLGAVIPPFVQFAVHILGPVVTGFVIGWLFGMHWASDRKAPNHSRRATAAQPGRGSPSVI